jgi:hypothetical protein
MCPLCRYTGIYAGTRSWYVVLALARESTLCIAYIIYFALLALTLQTACCCVYTGIYMREHQHACMLCIVRSCVCVLQANQHPTYRPNFHTNSIRPPCWCFLVFAPLVSVRIFPLFTQLKQKKKQPVCSCCVTHMSRSKVRSSSATTAKESTANNSNRNSYLTMYLLAIIVMLIACLAFYSHAMAAAASSSASATAAASHALCGNKDLWRASTKAGSLSSSPSSAAAPATWGSLRPGVYFGK